MKFSLLFKRQHYYLGEPNVLQFKNNKLLVVWYRQKAREVFIERMNYWSEKTGWKYTTLRITNAKTRWGSCGPKNSINFTWRLVMAPLSVIDYVIVHELAHTVEKNHSRSFWNKVALVMPDYRERRAWLKHHGRKFIF